MNASLVFIEDAKALVESVANPIELSAPDRVLRAQIGVGSCGSSPGLHVLTPLDAKADFDTVRGLGRAMAEHLADAHLDRLRVEQRKDKRAGRLYLDVMRNAYGQTAVVPYSLRAESGAPVATPIDWDELDRADVGPQRYDLRNARQRLIQKDEPWRKTRRHAASARLARERFEKLARG